jgi:hypothetical protein
MATLALLSIVALPAQAAPTLVSNNMTLSIGSDGKTLTRAGGVVISGADAVSYKTFACPSAQSAVTVLAPNTQPMGCTELFNASGTGPFTANDLSSAKVMTGLNVYSAYDTSRGAHIVTTAYVTDTLIQYHIRPASVLATNPAPPALTVLSAQVRPDGQTLRLGLSDMLHGSINQISTSEFTVTVDGIDLTLGANASVSGLNVDITLQTAVVTGAVVTFNRRSGGTVLTPTSGGAGIDAIATTNATNNSTVVGARRFSSGSAASSAPIKYSGPEFSGLSLKPVLNGSATTIEGRKLDEISSITVDGKAAKLSDATDKSLKLELPAGLAPGVYDLVVTTANHGKLTHMNAIRIREELAPTSMTIRGLGIFTGEEFKELTSFARTQNPEMITATCIVNSNSEGKSFTQARALCDRIAATNLNIKTTMFENRSTVQGSAIFARVVFSSEE